MIDFCSNHDFTTKIAGNSANFTAGGIINHRTHDHSVEAKARLGNERQSVMLKKIYTGS
jgi:hypothetical protein